MNEDRLIVRGPSEPSDGTTTKQLSDHEVRDAKRRGSPRAAVVLKPPVLGMAIKYAGLRGKEVRVIGQNRSTLGEEGHIQ